MLKAPRACAGGCSGSSAGRRYTVGQGSNGYVRDIWPLSWRYHSNVRRDSAGGLGHWYVNDNIKKFEHELNGCALIQIKADSAR
jgi:hypothetical protein